MGQKVNLTLVNSDGRPDEGTFTIRGLFSTGIPSYDQSAVFMPLDKAQAFTGTGGRASLIMILLNNQNDADQVAAALSGPGVTALTWSDLNKFFVETMAAAMSFYVILDFIVILIVAVIIVNTLLMSVFERVREMGILAALGMKGRPDQADVPAGSGDAGPAGRCRGHPASAWRAWPIWRRRAFPSATRWPPWPAATLR